MGTLAVRALSPLLPSPRRKDEPAESPLGARVEPEVVVGHGFGDESRFEPARSRPVDLNGQSRSDTVRDPAFQRELEELLERIPSGQAVLAQLRQLHAPVEFRDGGGSTFEDGRIVLDRTRGLTGAAIELVHELEHADGGREDPHPWASGREQFVGAMIADEARATVRAIEIKREMAEAGIDVSDAEVELEQEYATTYEHALRLLEQEHPDWTAEQVHQAARAAGLLRIERGYRTGEVVTANTLERYADYYGRAYDATRRALAEGRRPDPVVRPDAVKVGLNDAVADMLAAGPIPPDETHPAYTAMLERMRDLRTRGIEEIRMPVYVDPVSGRFGAGERDLSAEDYEGILKAAGEAGVRISVAAIPSHSAVGQFEADDSRHIERADRFATAMIELARIAARHGHWDFEIGNEPNAHNRFPSIDPSDPYAPQTRDRDAARYMVYLDRAYRSIHAASLVDGQGQPVKPRVSMAGLSHTDTEFLDALYRHGLRGRTDAVNLHPYDIGANAADVRANLERVRAVQLEHGDQDTPLWLTELGMEGTDAEKASHMRNLLSDGALPAYVQKVHWFNRVNTIELNPDGSPQLNPDGSIREAQYGLNSEESWNGLSSVARRDATVRPPPPVEPELAYTYSRYAAVLGEPTGESSRTEEGVAQRFEHGEIRYAGGRHEVWSTAGRLLDAREDGAGAIWYFESGSVRRDPHGHHQIHRWGEGWERTSPESTELSSTAARFPELGEPLGAAYLEASGRLRQRFQHGEITIARDGVRQVVVNGVVLEHHVPY